LAISGTRRNWYLVNATPDVCFQIESFPALHPGPSLRDTPVRGVLLTDAELDHTIGLLNLREGTPLEVHGSRAVLEALAEDFPVRQILDRYAPFRWIEIRAQEPFLLDEGALRVKSFRLGVKRPRYVSASRTEGDWVVGYRLEDLETHGVIVYAPAVEAWSSELATELGGVACAFVDGTFWTEDEMVEVGAGRLGAKAMGHLPISGPEGSAERLAALAIRHRIFVHLNNTNPVLDESSQAYRFLAEKGIEVGWDGLEFDI